MNAQLQPAPALFTPGLQVVPLEYGHIFGLRLQQAQTEFYDKFSPEYARALVQVGGGYTALVDGHPIACAGLVEQWHGRALAWALLGEDCGPYLGQVSREIRRVLRNAKYRRIEAQVDCQFAQGIRWARLLGFKVEARLEAFTPEGRDAFMYVRMQP